MEKCENEKVVGFLLRSDDEKAGLPAKGQLHHDKRLDGLHGTIDPSGIRGREWPDGAIVLGNPLHPIILRRDITEAAQLIDVDRLFVGTVDSSWSIPSYTHFREYGENRLLFISYDVPKNIEEYRARIEEAIRGFKVNDSRFSACVRFLPTTFAVFTSADSKRIEARLKNIVRGKNAELRLLIRPLTGQAAWYGEDPWTSESIDGLMRRLHEYQRR